MLRNSIALIIIFLTSISIAFSQSSALQFNEKVHDFGVIKEVDGPVDFKFVFTNTAQTPITIENVRASCGCTTPDWTKTEVEPGGDGFVQARYNPANRPGSFNKSLTVTTNSQERIVLYIKGNVEPKPRTIEDDFPTVIGALRVRYRAFNMGKLYTNGATTRNFEVYNSAPEEVSFNTEFQAPDYINVMFQPETIKPREKGMIVVTYDAEKKDDLGFMTDNITIYTNEEDSAKNFTVYASIEEYFPPMTKDELEQAPRLAIEESTYDFGSVKSAETVKTEFVLENKGKSELNIRKVSSSCGCIKVKLKSNDIKPESSAVLEVAFDATSRRGNQQKSITIFSNDPSAPTQRVMIKAYVQD